MEKILLILTMCGPSSCQEIGVPLYGATLLQCQMGAPQAVAAFPVRPGTYVKSWRCAPVADL